MKNCKLISTDNLKNKLERILVSQKPQWLKEIMSDYLAINHRVKSEFGKFIEEMSFVHLMLLEKSLLKYAPAFNLKGYPFFVLDLKHELYQPNIMVDLCAEMAKLLKDSLEVFFYENEIPDRYQTSLLNTLFMEVRKKSLAAMRTIPLPYRRDPKIIEQVKNGIEMLIQKMDSFYINRNEALIPGLSDLRMIEMIEALLPKGTHQEIVRNALRAFIWQGEAQQALQEQWEVPYQTILSYSCSIHQTYHLIFDKLIKISAIDHNKYPEHLDTFKSRFLKNFPHFFMRVSYTPLSASEYVDFFKKYFSFSSRYMEDRMDEDDKKKRALFRHLEVSTQLMRFFRVLSCLRNLYRLDHRTVFKFLSEKGLPESQIIVLMKGFDRFDKSLTIQAKFDLLLDQQQ